MHVVSGYIKIVYIIIATMTEFVLRVDLALKFHT